VIATKDGQETPLRVTSLEDATKARLVVSRSRRPHFVAPMTERLQLASVTACGSVGVKIARVAMAAADLYVHGGGGIKSWDLCGPEAVLVAAGGKATTLDGGPVDYAGDVVHAKGFIGTNGALHATIVQAIREVGDG
jgi:3'(2'), 5'-bisphosphate nucleotidase